MQGYVYTVMADASFSSYNIVTVVGLKNKEPLHCNLGWNPKGIFTGSLD